MKKFYTLLLILLTCLCVNAETLKTYSGDYDAIIEHNPLHPYGKATYSYYINSNEDRVYHGNFSYTDNNGTLKGTFRDNIQDGPWTYTKKLYKGNQLHIYVTFKNGYLEGKITAKVINRTGKEIAHFSANIHDNNIIGPIDFISHPAYDKDYFGNCDIYGHHITGNFDDNGLPVGKWTCKDRTRELTEDYQSNDIKISFRNITSGDRIIENDAEGIRIPYLPNIVVNIINKTADCIRLRDTPATNIAKFKFFHPADDFCGSLNFFDGDGENNIFRLKGYGKNTRNESYRFYVEKN